jgi:hypothetical protein
MIASPRSARLAMTGRFIGALDWPLAELAALLPKGTSFGRSDISSSVASPLMIACNDGTVYLGFG